MGSVQTLPFQIFINVNAGEINIIMDQLKPNFYSIVLGIKFYGKLEKNSIAFESRKETKDLHYYVFSSIKLYFYFSPA